MPFTDADCARCRRDFPSLARALDGRPLAFFDGPAGTQVPNTVIEAVSNYYRTANDFPERQARGCSSTPSTTPPTFLST